MLETQNTAGCTLPLSPLNICPEALCLLIAHPHAHCFTPADQRRDCSGGRAHRSSTLWRSQCTGAAAGLFPPSEHKQTAVVGALALPLSLPFLPPLNVAMDAQHPDWAQTHIPMHPLSPLQISDVTAVVAARTTAAFFCTPMHWCCCRAAPTQWAQSILLS